MDKKMTELGARLFGDRAEDVEQSLSRVERLMPLTPRYRQILATFGGAIVFDNGARYRPETRTPLTKPDGHNDLEILYGLGVDPHSLEDALSKYRDELPPSLMPVGEAPGGNLICVNDEGAVFLWDHESDRTEVVWTIARSLDEFVDNLEPSDAPIGTTDGIIESESFLDF